MEGFEGGWGMFDGAFTLFLLMLRMFHPLPFRCDGSDGRVAASYPADPGSNPALFIYILDLDPHLSNKAEKQCPLIGISAQWV